MAHLQLNPVTNPKMIGAGWKDLSRLGGVAALILLLYSLATMLILIVIGVPPSTAAETFARLQNNRIIALLQLDVLTMFVYMPLSYLLYLGIYATLRRNNNALSTLALILVFVGITLFLATPSPFSLTVLSDKYASATTEAQKSQLLAAGEAILASDMWHGTGAYIGGLLLQIGAVLISLVMLQGKEFSKTIAYTGFLTHGLDLLHLVFLPFMPELGKVLIAIAGTLYLIWFPLIGLRLFQLGQSKDVQVDV